MSAQRFRIERVEAKPLAAPLVEPFVIATARVDVTPNVLVEAEVVDLATGARATGLGEAATLFPVTKEKQQDLLDAFAALRCAPSAVGDLDAAANLARDLAEDCKPMQAGLETAFVDAIARLEGKPVRRLLARDAIDELVTDVTIPIASSEHVGALARQWRSRGFRSLKVKIGRDLDEAARALESLHRAAPDARVRIDANAALTADETIAFARAVDRLGLVVECWEQPCGKHALDELAKVAAALAPPVIADESCGSLGDLERIVEAKAADGVNLKLAKSGGVLATFALGRRARQHGLALMFGAMVETWLGIIAAANVAAALGGVEFVDLDTALLLASDPCVGGHSMLGDRLTLSNRAGLDVELHG